MSEVGRSKDSVSMYGNHMHLRKKKAGASTSMDFRPNATSSVMGSSFMKLGELWNAKAIADPFVGKMEPLRVKGFEGFIRTSLNRFDAA